MLIDFSVENYLSIKEPLTFSMIASKLDREPCSSLFDINSSFSLLPATMIYGFNASGKSNLIKAMYSLKRKIVYSKIPDISIINSPSFEYKPYKLDDEYTKKPTIMRIRAIINGKIYIYELQNDAHQIIYESLDIIIRDKVQNLFTREYNDITANFETDINLVKRLAGKNINKKAIIGSIRIFNNLIDTFVDWIENNFIIITSSFVAKENLGKTINYLINKNETFHKKLLTMLNEISYSNINTICAEKVTKSIEYNDLPEDIKNMIQTEGFSLKSENKLENILFEKKPADITLNTLKKGVSLKGNSRDVVFNLHEESEGTIKIYALYSYIYEALYLNKTLIIDEMTSFIHPLISRYIFELFQNPDENLGGQLISSTHTTDLLEIKSMRKDQIYITDKKFNDTKIYSLADIINVSHTENFRKAYLAGKYGGLNYFRRNLNE